VAALLITHDLGIGGSPTRKAVTYSGACRAIANVLIKTQRICWITRCSAGCANSSRT
jgi:hypothetical protein